MPAVRGKRKATFDPNKSDSDDETYGTSLSKTSKPKPSKPKSSANPRKKRRRQDSDDDDDDDEDSIEDESEVSPEESFAESEEEEVELGPNGRPKRKAAPRQAIVEEPTDEDEEEDEDQLQAAKSESDKEDISTPRKRRPQQKITTLRGTPGKFPPKFSPMEGTRRSTRARSNSASASRPTSSHQPPSRRSSRIAHDEAEEMYALSNSGHLVETGRQATSSPPSGGKRPRTGGKGIKKPTTSIVYEESQENASKRDERGDSEGGDQQEVAASQEIPEEDAADDDIINQIAEAAGREEDQEGVAEAAEVASTHMVADSGDDDDEEDPINKPSRTLRRRDSKKANSSADEDQPERGKLSTRRSSRPKRKARSSQRGDKESSDFNPEEDDNHSEDMSGSEDQGDSPRKRGRHDDGDDESPLRGAKRHKPNPRSRRQSDDNEEEEAEELVEELADLQTDKPRRRRQQQGQILYEPQQRERRQTRRPDYRIINPEIAHQMEEDDGAPAQSTPSKRNRGGGTSYQRSLFSTYGPFGGAGGPPPVLGGPAGLGAVAGADSDSSDDEVMQRPKTQGVGGVAGMTPTTTGPPNLGLYSAPVAQVHGNDPNQTPANLGKVKDKQALADADPLGVAQNINFDAVGGLEGHIDQLKEMVALPLLYPEVFQRFHVTPPRGVLFHGPPGTGKTLLARALASSVSAHGKKVTFYMRKGADALSKWVGEAEKQLRLLFEEARKNQPSIIFFDEIDGLAPVRSSKQEQIHASIVSTLLALMDGMDGRGQVIVIGATNRPDTIDPALRRPGRFDREFYFPLPNLEARRAILDIHTKGWEPPLSSSFKDDIAHATKGYGGADLRALCTEAALNAVQRRYPQIYKSNEKLLIKPETINVTAKDFMISVKKMVPSSERSASSGASPLPKQIEPLLREPLRAIENLVAEILPQRKPVTALQEAEYEDAEADRGMMVERMQQEFERSRVFRPRVLVQGQPGMGQQYLAAALLNHFEGLHVQAFDLPTLLSDSTRSAEAAIVQLFTEVRRHKPSVIYIPNVDVWYETVGQSVISTFLGLLRSVPPSDPILLLGVLENESENINPQMLKDMFGFSKKSRFTVDRPGAGARQEYFESLAGYLNAAPDDFPDPANRKKRNLERLLPAPPEAPKDLPAPTKAEEKAQKKKDRLHLNLLKIRIQPVMDHIKLKYKKFRVGVIDEGQIAYLYDEEDPAIFTSDLSPEQQQQLTYRPFEKTQDDHGEFGLREVATGNFYYNIEIVTIEKRLSNGYYKRTKDFLSDIKKLTKDAKAIGDSDRLIKANELQANVEVDMANIDAENPWLAGELENVYNREIRRQRELEDKAKAAATEEDNVAEDQPSDLPPKDAVGASSTDQTGPIVLGQPLPHATLRDPVVPLNPSDPSNPSNPSQQQSSLTNGTSDLSDLHHHPQSNGTSVPSRRDTHMTNSDDVPSAGRDTQGSSFGPSAQTRPMESYTGAPTLLEHRRSIPGSLSQVSAVTPIVEGASIRDYTNYASTTSSDKKNTGSSDNKNNTQSTEGRDGGPGPGQALAKYPSPLEANSDVPPTVGNTQESQISNRANSGPSDHISSQGQPHLSSQPDGISQPPAVPAFPREQSRSNINSLLNDVPAPSRALVPAHDNLLVEKEYTDDFIDKLVRQTSGSSLEQLEQIYSAIMGQVWKMRGEWDRTLVVKACADAVDEVAEDIEQMQGFNVWSMEALNRGR